MSLYSKTETEVNINLEELISSFGENHPSIQYIRRNIMRHKEKIICFWTDRYLHFGSTVTSRVEGAHFILKQYLESPAIDLLELHLRYEKLIENYSHKELKVLMCSEQLRSYPSYSGTEFNQLRKKVSIYALEKILKQVRKYKTSLETVANLDQCTHSIRDTLGNSVFT